MKLNSRLSILSLLLLFLLVAFQNCGDNVAFSTIEYAKFSDMRWDVLSSPKVTTTSDIKKMDWNKDGVDDLVFAYSGGANKITEICMAVKTNKMNSHCYPLGEDNIYDEDGNTTYMHNVTTVSIEVADIDKDGRMDIVEFNSGRSMSSYVIFNRGMENGRPKYVRQAFHNHTYAASLMGNLFDYDNDGDLDIVFVEMVMARCNARDSNNVCTNYGISMNGSSGSPVTLKLNVVKNSGTFSATSTRHAFDLPNTYQFNADPNLYYKTLQILSLDKSSSSKRKLIFINDRFEEQYSVNFRNAQPVIQEVPKLEYIGNFWSGQAGDVDKDGRDDFIYLCSSGTNSELYFGKEDGSYEVVQLPDSCQLTGATFVDLNMDGNMDIVASRYQSAGFENSYEILVYMGLGGREFSARETIRNNMPKLYELGTPIELINIDGNQWMDFAVGTYQDKDMLIMTTVNSWQERIN